jgi:hypothetical protein
MGLVNNEKLLSSISYVHMFVCLYFKAAEWIFHATDALHLQRGDFFYSSIAIVIRLMLLTGEMHLRLMESK